MKKLLMFSALFLWASPVVNAGQAINASPDHVYQAAMEVALDMGAMPTTSNDALHFFKTDPVKLKPSVDDCDCGSMFGIPYVKDDRTVVKVSYIVRVKGSDQQSEIDVSTSIVGYYDESKNAISAFMADKKRDTKDLLDCKSKGQYEHRFIDRVQNIVSK